MRRLKVSRDGDGGVFLLFRKMVLRNGYMG